MYRYEFGIGNWKLGFCQIMDDLIPTSLLEEGVRVGGVRPFNTIEYLTSDKE